RVFVCWSRDNKATLQKVEERHPLAFSTLSTSDMPNVLPRLPAVRDLVKMYGLSARSQLGQNFILDKNITDKITASAGVSYADALVVEVGPGPGLLTRSILETGVKNVVAVERDVRFLPTLTQLAEASEDKLKILSGDILKIPHSDILNAARIFTSPSMSSTSTINSSDNIHIIGNLPFNVASPLLLQFLHMQSRREGLFGVGNVHMTLMFQEEVGQRLAANVGTKHRGRLSVMAQSLCDVRIVYEVPSSVFVPIPKVDNNM
ncbi:mitochondrial dimethyladenosine transferase 1, partial [Endogone sp. FLAS-F59071]